MPTSLGNQSIGFKLILWAVVIVPLTLSITTIGLILSPQSSYPWARIAIYITLLLCIFSIFNSFFNLLVGKIRVTMGLICIVSFFVYSLASLMILNRMPATSLTSHYSMKKEERQKIYDSLVNLRLGDNYIIAMKKLPPVPEGAPVTMRTSKSNGIVLRYYLEKKNKERDAHPKDSHITLFFDKNQELVEVASANIN